MKLAKDGQERHRRDHESTIATRPIHNPCVKNIGNARSLRQAIDAMCGHCMGCTEEHMEPGFRDDIRNCTSTKCPLWYFRPHQSKPEGGAV